MKDIYNVPRVPSLEAPNDYSVSITVLYDDGHGENRLMDEPVSVSIPIVGVTRQEAMDEAQRFEMALGGLRNLFKWHALDDPEDMSSSAADQCEDLYVLMGHLGLKVV